MLMYIYACYDRGAHNVYWYLFIHVQGGLAQVKSSIPHRNPDLEEFFESATRCIVKTNVV